MLDRAAGRAGTEGADEGAADVVDTGVAVESTGAGAIAEGLGAAATADVAPARSQGFGGEGMMVVDGLAL